MKPIWLILGGLVLIILLAGSFLFVRTLAAAGQFRPVEPHFAGTCGQVSAPAGPEDIAIDRQAGIAYVSAYDRRAVERGNAVRGDIFALDLRDIAAGFRPLTGGMPDDFRPHGIDLWRAPDGRLRLFAVNHPAGGQSRVEIFEVGADGLGHLETVADPLIRTPNDVAAAGPRAFYVTNDHGYAEGPMRMVEAFLQLDATDVIYWDGLKAEVADDGLTFANGIALSADGRTLYLTETTDGALRFYDRDPETGAIALRPGTEGLLRLASGLDNIDVAPDGSLWIAGHPKLFDLMDHASSAEVLSPSQVIRVEKNRDGPGGEVDEIYLDRGEEISGASVAAVYEGRMMLGTIFDAKILICDLPPTL